MNLKNYAYIGDAVWELFIREITVKKTENAKELHNITINLVNAKKQENLFNSIREKLNDSEQELARRGRNLSIPISRRSNQFEYRTATAFEVLIGYWYYHDKQRLEEILSELKKNI